MLNLLLGWYVREKLKGHVVSVVFEESLAAGDSGSLAIADAVDGATHAGDLVNYDYLIYEVFAYADPGLVQLDILPDNTSSKKVRISATKQPAQVRLTPPLLAEVETIINYTNENQPNNLYLCMSALKLPESSVPRFTLISEDIAEMLPAVNQLKETNALLANVIKVLQGEEVVEYTDATAERKTAHREFCGFRGG